MKKSSFILILLFTIFYSFNVYATDTVVSMNKYNEEKFMFIEDSFDNENKKDGFITGGYILREVIEQDNQEFNDYQAIVVKYDSNNKIAWRYIYGSTKEDYLDYLSYSYNSEGTIDGYLLVVKPTANIGEEVSNESLFIKLSLDGKKVLEKNLNINKDITINKIIPSYNGEGIVDGYITIGNNNDNSYLIKLDRDLNVIFEKEVYKDIYTDINYNDIELVYKDNSLIGYVVLKELVTGDDKHLQLVRFNINGEEETVIADDLDKYESCKLAESTDGFILYGATNDVKLSKGDVSYYLINYNSNNENNWEIFGDTPLDKNKVVKLLPLKDNGLKEYLLLYSNNVDKSTEVIKVALDGTIKNKVKKIYDEYYTIEDFSLSNNIIYLVGQINCPKDDTCEYDSNSLFLISDEEKVIEVKDNDSRNILIITCIFVALIAGTIVIRKKKVVKKKK